MLQQERMAIVDALVADISTADNGQLRRYLYGLSNEELQKTATTYQTLHTEAARAVEHNPRVIEAQQRLREVEEQLQWRYIFRTPINGRVLVDNEANRNLLRSQVDEIRGDQISPAWFRKILAENPALANQLAWHSADILNPVKRKQAAAAEAEKAREVFRTFAKANGYADNDANFHLTKDVVFGGNGFSKYELEEAVQSGRLRLAPASPEQLAEWAQQAAEERQDWLANQASPAELRAAAQAETEQRRQEAQRAEQERSLAERAKADAAYGYPPLPEIHVPTGERIDAAWLNRISNTNLPLFKALLIKHGNFALTQRLKGLEA